MTYHLIIDICVVEGIGVEGVGDCNLGCAALIIESLHSILVCRANCQGVDAVDIPISSTRVTI